MSCPFHGELDAIDGVTKIGVWIAAVVGEKTHAPLPGHASRREHAKGGVDFGPGSLDEDGGRVGVAPDDGWLLALG